MTWNTAKMVAFHDHQPWWAGAGLCVLSRHLIVFFFFFLFFSLPCLRSAGPKFEISVFRPSNGDGWKLLVDRFEASVDVACSRWTGPNFCQETRAPCLAVARFAGGHWRACRPCGPRRALLVWPWVVPGASPRAASKRLRWQNVSRAMFRLKPVSVGHASVLTHRSALPAAMQGNCCVHCGSALGKFGRGRWQCPIALRPLADCRFTKPSI